MKKAMQVVDFIWILFYTGKIAFKKIFFIGKKTPDLYIADKEGFFYNQSDIRYAPVSVLWDVFKISRIYKLLAGNHFYSVYLRGGAVVGNHNKKISDLDLIIFLKKPNNISRILIYLSENLNRVFKNYSSIDLLYIDIEEYEKNNIDVKIESLIKLQSVYVFGKKIFKKNKIKSNDETLWSFFSSAVSDKQRKTFFITKLNYIDHSNLDNERVAVQQIAKSIIRGLFEQVTPNKNLYTKNILHIKTIIENDIKTNLNEKSKKMDTLNLINHFEDFLKSKENINEFKKILLKTLDYF
jgi:hypothetical protein